MTISSPSSTGQPNSLVVTMRSSGRVYWAARSANPLVPDSAASRAISSSAYRATAARSSQPSGEWPSWKGRIAEW
nr:MULTISPECIES: hypothetical protein [unclassified Streptomyces]